MAEDKDIDSGWLLMQAYLLANYEPAEKPGNGVILLTTGDIYSLLQAHCPGDYTKQDLFEFLIGQGFSYRDKDLKFEWLLKKKHARPS